MRKWYKIICILAVACLMQAVLAQGALADATIHYGRVDDNETVDASDALLCLQHSVFLIVLTADQITAADVSDDGTVDALDALLILQFSVGLIDRFLAEEMPTEPEQPDDKLQPVRREGIDVSRWQEEIDWAAVKADGIEFAMIRTGFGRDEPNQTDPYFVVNVEGAKAQGIPIGCYHYSYATSVENAVKEAEFMIKIMGDYQFEYPVVLDLEDKVIQALGRQAITEIAIAFTDTLRQAGYYPAIYTNLNWAQNYIDMSRLEGVDLWLAHWGVDEPEYDGDYTMWQYTSEGLVDGIDSRVDRNICYVDYPAYIKANGYNGFSIESVQPEK